MNGNNEKEFLVFMQLGKCQQKLVQSLKMPFWIVSLQQRRAIFCYPPFERNKLKSFSSTLLHGLKFCSTESMCKEIFQVKWDQKACWALTKSIHQKYGREASIVTPDYYHFQAIRINCDFPFGFWAENCNSRFFTGVKVFDTLRLTSFSRPPMQRGANQTSPSWDQKR